MATKEFPFNKINEKLDGMLSPLEEIFVYKDPYTNIRESLVEENLPIAALASEAVINGLVVWIDDEQK